MCNSKNAKLIFTLAMIFLLILSSVNGVNAAKRGDAIPVFDFVNGIEEDIQPIKYNDTDLSIKGKALEGTNITISTFWYKPDNEKTIISKNKLSDQDNSSGEWILQQSESCQVGLSGIFGVSVTIKPGKNKIVVEADNGSSYEMEIENVNNEEIFEKINSIFFKNLELGF